ncbi:MAG: hypothetical protein PHR61_01835 [Candidatus Absconditabacteria bacterium]|nr:hypothetical protein [Candidatus Absconditabacteria bacterium]
MRISNQALTKTFLEADIASNDLVLYFDILIKLLKKHKKRLLDSNILEIIKANDETLYTFIILLKHHNKLDISSIKSISTEIKKQSKDYIPTFTVNIIKNPKENDIVEKLKSKFQNCEIKKQDGFELGAYISGEGWYYKRNIDQDLQKLL